MTSTTLKDQYRDDELDSRAAEMLRAARALGPEFEAAAREAEADRMLPTRLVDRMREAGLFWMKTPRELGGSELDPIGFSDVIEAIAYHDASAGWTAMIGNGVTGTAAGWLPEEGVRELFRSYEDKPILAGQYVPRGRAVPVDGGYRVTGRWSFCSGIAHASWVVGGCTVEGSEKVVIICAPKSSAQVQDTWQVAGLQGTGSNDFSLLDTFIPSVFTMQREVRQVERGGSLFRQPHAIFLSNELSPLAVGVARRALDDMRDLARGTVRQLDGEALSARAAFQKSLGRAEAKWRAARLLYREAVEEAWDLVLDGAEFDGPLGTSLRARHTLVVEMCVELVEEIFRYGGGRVLALDNPMQRHYRNLIATRQHLYVTEETFELAGKDALETPTG